MCGPMNGGEEVLGGVAGTTVRRPLRTDESNRACRAGALTGEGEGECGG